MSDQELRDHFAGLAMQTLLASITGRAGDYDRIARQAYYAADAMMRAREPKP